ncbi:hypothetical protein MKX03_033080 [Papaver bracteatum]|nr:hypothetical protein MKX03_033080 [Papaver bracteatum]
MTRKRASVSVGDKRKKRKKRVVDDDSGKIVPWEIIIDNILTRLPFRSLARFGCVSKYWYNSIFNDERFATLNISHQITRLSRQKSTHSNTNNFIFSLLNVFDDDVRDDETCYIFNLRQKRNRKIEYELLSRTHFEIPNELVGYCNGLVCIREMTKDNVERARITVINPARNETLALFYLNPITTRGGGNGIGNYLCHGFGFDSLSHQYKVVVIYTTRIEAEEEFVCMVYTSGVAEWKRKFVSISEITPPVSSSFPLPRRRMVTRPWREYCRSATLCGGDLYWKITNYIQEVGGDTTINDNNKEEMLLSFSICSEKMQFIRLPTACSTTAVSKKILTDFAVLVDHHLLEFKGYPCIAISEKRMSIIPGHRVGHRFGHSYCHCGFDVRMYVLKDTVEQVWTEEELFEVNFRDNEFNHLPDAFRCSCLEEIDRFTPPTRILSFSDQLVFYWFDGKNLVYFNFHMNNDELMEVNVPSSPVEIRDILNAKLKGISPCPYVDYHLHAKVLNIISLKTFIPQGGRKFECYYAFQKFLTSTVDNAPAGWLEMGRSLRKYEVFY